jgi:cupin 2 domain-containing protein
LERIISRGQSSPEGFWYDQPEDEWVLLVRGAATLRFADSETIDLSAGDYLFLPARRQHRVESVSVDAVWVALHVSPPRAAVGDG